MAKKAEKKRNKIPIPILLIIHGSLLFASYQSISVFALGLFGQTVRGTVDVYGNRIDNRRAEAGRSRTVTKGYYFTVDGTTYRGRVTYKSDEAWPSLKEGETRRELIRYLPFFPYVNAPSSFGDFSEMTWGQIFYYLFVPVGCFGIFFMIHGWETWWKKPGKRGRTATKRTAKKTTAASGVTNRSSNQNEGVMKMEQFDNLTEAVEFASARCANWTDSTDADKKYSVSDMTGMAEAADGEDPLDEDSFYAVSPAGAIGISNDGENIAWLFIATAAPDEVLPARLPAAPQANFCTQCGTPVVPGARFCGNCGVQVG